MTTTKEQARETIDKALYEWVESLGYDATDFDYSQLNELLDDIESLL